MKIDRSKFDKLSSLEQYVTTVNVCRSPSGPANYTIDCNACKEGLQMDLSGHAEGCIHSHTEEYPIKYIAYIAWTLDEIAARPRETELAKICDGLNLTFIGYFADTDSNLEHPHTTYDAAFMASDFIDRQVDAHLTAPPA